MSDETMARTSNEDLVAELEAAASKWVLEKNKYTLGSLRDARAAVLKRLTPETEARPPVRRFRPLVSDGHIHSISEVGNPRGFGGWNAEYVLASDYDALAGPAQKANEGQSCRCPAKPGEDCPLTNEQCLKRTELSEVEQS
jgi:hypothetical protein